jgi:hypothetical protein
VLSAPTLARAVGEAVAQFQRSNEQRKWLDVQEQG